MSSSSSFTRLCDHQDCIICQQKIQIHQEGGRLTRPTKQLQKLSLKTLQLFRCKWKMKDHPLQTSMDYVHYDCWEDVIAHRSSLTKPEQRILTEVEEYIERFSTEEVIKQQVKEVIQLLLPTERIVAFTGAGVSASAGLATYRGADGIDTLSSLAANTNSNSTSKGMVDLTKTSLKNKKEVKAEDEEVVEEVVEEEEEEDVDYSKLQPTFTHYSLVKLLEMNKLRYCITQNCDNLHIKAGLDRIYVSDLHGNVFIEYCPKCFTEYERDYCVDLYSTDCYEESWYKKCSTCGLNHFTGRNCEKGKCKGKLEDTIINFGDDLHEFICGGFRKAKLKSKTADVCLCLGSSLSVYPASDLPMLAKHRVIVNLQATELDEEATVRLYCTTDHFFQLLMPGLEKAIKEPKVKKSVQKRKKQDEEVEVIELAEDEKVVYEKGGIPAAIAIDSNFNEEKEQPKRKKTKKQLIDLSSDNDEDI